MFVVDVGINWGVTSQSWASPPDTFSYRTYADWAPVFEILLTCQSCAVPKPLAPIKVTQPEGGTVVSNPSGI